MNAFINNTRETGLSLIDKGLDKKQIWEKLEPVLLHVLKNIEKQTGTKIKLTEARKEVILNLCEIFTKLKNVGLGLFLANISILEDIIRSLDLAATPKRHKK